MSMSFDEVYEQFTKIDTDGNQSLSLEELTEFSKTLTTQLSTEEIETIFKHMDVNQDGQVSFGEFWEWWQSKENNLLPLLYTKQAVTQGIAKLQKTVSNSQSDSDSDKPIHFTFGLQVGETLNTSSINLNSFTGELAAEKSKAVREALHLEENEGHIVFIFKVTTNVDEAKTALTNLVEQAKEFASAVLPPKAAEQYLSIVQIKVETFQNDSLLLSISSSHPFVQGMVQQQVALTQQIQGDKHSTSFQLNISSDLDLEKIVENFDQSLAHQVLSGLNVNLDVSTSDQAKSNFQAILSAQLKNKGDTKSQIAQLALNSLLNGISLNFKFANLDELLKGFPSPTVEQLVQKVASKGNPCEIVASVPILQEFIDFLTNNTESQLETLGVIPNCLIQLQLKTHNLSSLYQKISAFVPTKIPVVEESEADNCPPQNN